MILLRNDARLIRQIVYHVLHKMNLIDESIRLFILFIQIEMFAYK